MKTKTKKRRTAKTQKPSPRRKAGGDYYAKNLDRAQRNIMGKSRTARDIAPCPACTNPPRRDACLASLRTFLETCFPGTFSLAWSRDQLEAIQQCEAVCTGGGKFALGMPRGGGKTSIFERAALWAVLTGKRRYVAIVGNSQSAAEQNLEAIKSELEHNAILAGLFPKAAYPIQKLEGQSRRCVGQLFDGVRTEIKWLRHVLVLPTMAGPHNQASGAILATAGITSGIRGLKRLDVQGRTFRPDLILVDDPQTRESATSAMQTEERIAIIESDLLGLAAPDREIAALCALTVIERGDLSDQLLDPAKYPSWHGRRCKALITFPTDEKSWEEYRRLRVEAQIAHDRTNAAATEFYREHRAAMDAGAEVAWPERHEQSELSGLHHCMNKRIDAPDMFAAEYQNEPRPKAAATSPLKADAIAARVNGYERGTAGPNAEKITAFIDPAKAYIPWMICWWDGVFSGGVLDYGTWPEQNSKLFTKANATNTLARMYPGDENAGVYAGLGHVVDALFARRFYRADGAELYVNRLLIDTGYFTEAVRRFIVASKFRAGIIPSKGVGIGPGQTAMSDYTRKPGELFGPGWLIGKAGVDRLRLLRFDANFWKSRLAEMLTRPMGGKSLLTLFGQNPADHQLLSMHLAAETPIELSATATGRTVTAWQKIPDRDNEFLDCAVGCAVAASVEKISLISAAIPAKPAIVPMQRPPARPHQRVYYSNEHD